MISAKSLPDRRACLCRSFKAGSGAAAPTNCWQVERLAAQRLAETQAPWPTPSGLWHRGAAAAGGENATTLREMVLWLN
jgi:hypothetical protein